MPVPAMLSEQTRRVRSSEGYSPRTKRPRVENLACDSRTPLRRLTTGQDKLVCWICGYYIKQKKSVRFECCDNGKFSHTLCWRKQNLTTSEVMCCNVRHYFKRDAKYPDYNVTFEVSKVSTSRKRSRGCSIISKMSEMASDMYCPVCDSMIDTSDPASRDHLKYQCHAVPSPVLEPGFTDAELAMRMAALATKKMRYSHNFTPHQHSKSSFE